MLALSLNAHGQTPAPPSAADQPNWGDNERRRAEPLPNWGDGYRSPPPPRTARPRVRRWLLGAEVGLGTPVGIAGLTGEFRIIPELSLGAGVGLSVANPSFPSFPSDGRRYGGGPVFAAFSVLRILRGVVTPILRVAYSNGRYSHLISADGEYGEIVTEETSPHAQFLQGDVGVEFHYTFSYLRFSVGGAAMLNPGQLQCYYHTYGYSLGPCQADVSVNIPTMSVGYGAWF